MDERLNAEDEPMPTTCPGRMRWQRVDHTGPVVCSVCHIQDYEQHEGDPCRAGVQPHLARLWVCPACGWAATVGGMCDGGSDGNEHPACGEVREPRYSYHGIQTCHDCERLGFTEDGSVVITDPGDRSSPPDGYWLCDSCADEAQQKQEAAEADYQDRKFREQYESGPRTRGQHPTED